jgi:hypothetical protein
MHTRATQCPIFNELIILFLLLPGPSGRATDGAYQEGFLPVNDAKLQGVGLLAGSGALWYVAA